jgi:hypothetical protein
VNVQALVDAREALSKEPAGAAMSSVEFHRRRRQRCALSQCPPGILPRQPKRMA